MLPRHQTTDVFRGASRSVVNLKSGQILEGGMSGVLKVLVLCLGGYFERKQTEVFTRK